MNTIARILLSTHEMREVLGLVRKTCATTFKEEKY